MDYFLIIKSPKILLLITLLDLIKYNNDISTIEKTLIFLMNKSSEEIIEMKNNAYITASRLFNIDSYIQKMGRFLNKLKELYE